MTKIKKSNKKAAFSNPVYYYNNHATTDQLLSDIPNLSPVGDKSGSLRDKKGCLYSPIFEVPGYYKLNGEPDHKDLSDGLMLSKFELLQVYKFGGNFNAAATYCATTLMDVTWPYIMVANDIYKIIEQKDEWGNPKIEMKPYKRETITLLETKSGVERTSNRFFEDFCVLPNNKAHTPVCGSNYNLYRPFGHKALTGDVTNDDVSYTLGFFKHIFGDQFGLGLQYFKILYEQPTQMLPILVLVSKERHTGKSTFLDYLSMVFGGNFVQLMAQDIMGDFNAHFAYANIIGIDETLVDKVHAVEKIKSLVTSRRIMVNDKFIKSYMLPFYGKIVMTSNKVTDFMKVDDEEIRFWVRKLNKFGKIDKQFFPRLNAEIPAFLKYIETRVEMPEYQSRMVFSPDQLQNEYLEAVKEESRSSLYKDIEMRLEEFMLNNPGINPIQATASDIKDIWYKHDSKITLAYIRKVLKDEFGLNSSEPKYYTRHLMGGVQTSTGRVFEFTHEPFYVKKYDDPENAPF
jgi:hypothetical protein